MAGENTVTLENPSPTPVADRLLSSLNRELDERERETPAILVVKILEAVPVTEPNQKAAAEEALLGFKKRVESLKRIFKGFAAEGELPDEANGAKEGRVPNVMDVPLISFADDKNLVSKVAQAFGVIPEGQGPDYFKNPDNFPRNVRRVDSPTGSSFLGFPTKIAGVSASYGISGIDKGRLMLNFSPKAIALSAR